MIQELCAIQSNRRSLALLLLCGMLCCTAALAEDGAASRRGVTRITVQGNELLSEQQILDALGLKTGMAFNAEALKKTISEWNETTKLGSISYRVEPAEEGGVQLTLQLRERIILTDIQFKGNERLSAPRLAALAGVEPGGAVTPSDVRAVEERIGLAYRKMGYAAASAKGTFTVLSEQERRLTFYISEGARAFVRRITFRGNESFKDKKLRRNMESKKRGLLRWFRHGWFDSEVFQGDMVRLAAFYRDKGFLDVAVSGSPVFGDDMRKVTLQVEIDEGPLYRVANVRFEGNKLFRDSELLAAISLFPGEPYCQSKLDGSARTIADLYAEQGHMDVSPRKGNLVAATTFTPETGRVDVRFRINEGEPVYIRRIRIKGLTKSREKVIRRNLAFYPGERARKSRLEESERLLINTGFFDTSSGRPVQITLEPDEGALRDAVV